MTIAELFIIAVGLSMDACAVAICKGLSVKKATLKQALIVGAYFGGFQGLMPAIGYVLGSQFQTLIVSIDHWIAFVLLGTIGGNMIRESREASCDIMDNSFTFKAMLPLAVATSIDALAVGVTFAFLNGPIIPAVSFIGLTTFVMSAVGVGVGAKLGGQFGKKAEFAGGVILIVLGCKILLEHLGVL